MTRNQNPAGEWPAARPAPLPRPRPATPGGGENAGQPPVHPWHATQARDYTPSPAVAAPRAPRGRGPRGDAKITAINEAAPFKALELAQDTLTSVLTQARHANEPAAAAWCWTVVHIIDGLASLIEGGTRPHPWFRDHAHWGLNPDGWQPPAALALVADRIAGRRNGETSV
jgi:hypothetical protein